MWCIDKMNRTSNLNNWKRTIVLTKIYLKHTHIDMLFMGWKYIVTDLKHVQKLCKTSTYQY